MQEGDSMETLLLFLGLILALLLLGGVIIRVGILEERIEKLERR